MIGPKSIADMKQHATDQIDAFAKQIDIAFIKAEDGKLKVSLSFDICKSKIKPEGIDIDCTLSFVTDRVKDKVSSTVVENQIDLPLSDKVYKLNGG
jgi:hypothetical protein